MRAALWPNILSLLGSRRHRCLQHTSAFWAKFMTMLSFQRGEIRLSIKADVQFSVLRVHTSEGRQKSPGDRKYCPEGPPAHPQLTLKNFHFISCENSYTSRNFETRQWTNLSLKKNRSYRADNGELPLMFLTLSNGSFGDSINKKLTMMKGWVITNSCLSQHKPFHYICTGIC